MYESNVHVHSQVTYINTVYTLLVCLDLGFILSGSDEMPPNPQALQGTHGKHHKGVQVACCLPMFTAISPTFAGSALHGDLSLFAIAW